MLRAQSVLLLCATVVPCELMAQDSQVTVGDNGGMGQTGQGNGKKNGPKKPDAKTPADGHIGALHAYGHGFRKDNGKNHDVREGSHVPYCLEATSTDHDNLYPLKDAQWSLVVNSPNGPSIIWPSLEASHQVFVQPDASKWASYASGSTGSYPDQIYLTGNSTVSSATLSVTGSNGSTTQNFLPDPKNPGHVTFAIHYCHKTNGCKNPTYDNCVPHP
jgi:hypothetical protein